MRLKSLILLFLLFPISAHAPQKELRWGFFGHQLINRLAVFTLPPEMFGFYKHHIRYLTENAVNPDKRRYIVKTEAPCHYIDLDIYGDSAVYKMPRYWKKAVEKYTEDTLMTYGIVPWHIEKMKYRLVKAFANQDVLNILRLSADLGHYIGDANVPLHTTENYNGQKTNQIGIHGFWESRLPELFSENYDLFVGQAQFIPNTQLRAWEAVTNAHLAMDSVLRFEKLLTAQFDSDKKYGFETRNRITTKTYSYQFSSRYHDALDGQVERQMRRSIKMVGDFWLTCWVEAGQPDLSPMLKKGFQPAELDSFKQEQDSLQIADSVRIKSREHEH